MNLITLIKKPLNNKKKFHYILSTSQQKADILQFVQEEHSFQVIKIPEYNLLSISRLN